MKKIIFSALILIFLITGCQHQPGTSPTEQNTDPSDITLPEIQYGLTSDTLQNRFVQIDDTLYFATDDGIYTYQYDNSAPELFILADMPSFLTALNGQLVFREVTQRDEEFNPLQFKLSIADLAAKQTKNIALGYIDWCYSYNNMLYYVSENQALYAWNMTTEKESVLLSGMIAGYNAYQDKIYLNIDDNLSVYSIKDNNSTVLDDQAFPVSIFAVSDGVYYSSEDRTGLRFFDTNNHTVTDYTNAPEWGVTIYEDQLYTIQNENGFRLLNYNNTQYNTVCELGKLQSASVPYFYNDLIYFYITSDEYYGLISYDKKTHNIIRYSLPGG